MGDGVAGVFQIAHGLFHARQRVVDAPRQHVDFIARVAHRNARLEVAFLDLGQHGIDAGDRTRHFLVHQGAGEQAQDNDQDAATEHRLDLLVEAVVGGRHVHGDVDVEAVVDAQHAPLEPCRALGRGVIDVDRHDIAVGLGALQPGLDEGVGQGLRLGLGAWVLPQELAGAIESALGEAPFAGVVVEQLGDDHSIAVTGVEIFQRIDAQIDRQVAESPRFRRGRQIDIAEDQGGDENIDRQEDQG